MSKQYKKFDFDFKSMFPIAAGISLIVVAASLAIFLTKGLNYGVDFRGGSEIQMKFEKSVSLEEVRSSLTEAGFSSSQVQSIGEADQNEFLVKVSSKDDLNKVTEDITKMFNTKFSDAGLDIRKTDIVGPKAGEQLRISAFQALAWSLLLIMIYIGLRFDFQYAPGAIVALVHDVVIVIGVFCLTDKEFSLQIVGALLAIIGYSVNDTVIVYDRVREHVNRTGSTNLGKLINISINETLPRTILTSATTIFVSAVMFLMGGGVIHDFFFAVTIGILVGTYSSIFVAAPTILFFNKFQSKTSKATA